MTDEPTIDDDISCVGCGYNLRTLRIGGLCPECGGKVILSLLRASATSQTAAELVGQYRRRRFAEVAASTSYPVDAFLFVSDAMKLARSSGPRHQSGRYHVSARDVCRAVREYAFSYFNDRAEALDLLTEWKIRSSEDVGRVVYAMVAAGMLVASPDDSQSDFDGLFVIETLFDDDTVL